MGEQLSFRGHLKGHSDWVTSIACPIDNSDSIISCSRDKGIMSWSLTRDAASATGVQLAGVPKRRLTGHGGFVQDVVISSDGQFALSGSWDSTLRLWDLNTGATTRRFVGHTKDVLSVAFSVDNRQIVSGSRDRSIKLWNTLGECKYTMNDADAHQGWVSCVRFSPVNTHPIIVSAGWDKVRWAVVTGSDFAGLTRQSNNRVFFVPASFSSPFSTCLLPYPQLYPFQPPSPPPSPLPRPLSSIPSIPSFLPSPSPSTSPPLLLSPSPFPLASFFSLPPTPSARRSPPQFLLTTCKLRHSLLPSTPPLLPVPSPCPFPLSPPPPSSSPLHLQVVKVWNLTNCKLRQNLLGHTGYVNTVTVSPDGSLCASGGKDGVAMLWDLAEGKRLYSLDAGDIIHSLCFSPNRYWLCAATQSSIKIWDLESKSLVDTLVPDYELVRARGSTEFKGQVRGGGARWGRGGVRVEGE
ncbi:unnamed protein product [Closterium sp. NIES-54]